MIDTSKTEIWKQIADSVGLPWKSIACQCHTSANALYRFAERVEAETRKDVADFLEHGFDDPDGANKLYANQIREMDKE